MEFTVNECGGTISCVGGTFSRCAQSVCLSSHRQSASLCYRYTEDVAASA